MAALDDNHSSIGPAGTVRATIGDWAKFAALHLQGARGEKGLLLAPGTFKKLHTPVVDEKWALGWVVMSHSWSDGPVLGHKGTNGRWYSRIKISASENIAVLAVANAGGKPAGAATEKACNRMAAYAKKNLVGEK